VANVSIPDIGYYLTFAAVAVLGYAVYLWRYQRVQA